MDAKMVLGGAAIIGIVVGLSSGTSQPSVAQTEYQKRAVALEAKFRASQQQLHLLERVERDNRQFGVALTSALVIDQPLTISEIRRLSGGVDPLATTILDQKRVSQGGATTLSAMPFSGLSGMVDGASGGRERLGRSLDLANNPSTSILAHDDRVDVAGLAHGSSATSGAVNVRSGEYYAPTGDNGFVSTRDGTYYAKSGTHGVIDTRTGRHIPTN